MASAPLHAQLLLALEAERLEAYAPDQTANPAADSLAEALRLVLELCEARMAEAAVGGLTDVDTIWPSEIIGIIAAELGVVAVDG